MIERTYPGFFSLTSCFVWDYVRSLIVRKFGCIRKFFIYEKTVEIEFLVHSNKLTCSDSHLQGSLEKL